MDDQVQVPNATFKTKSFMLDSGQCPLCGDVKAEIGPGESRDVVLMPQTIFRAEHAEPIPGIDYDAFVVEGACIGSDWQLYRESRPARELFERLRRPTDKSVERAVLEKHWPEGDERNYVLPAIQIGLCLTMRVKNVSAVPQRFAIRLVGKAIL